MKRTILCLLALLINASCFYLPVSIPDGGVGTISDAGTGQRLGDLDAGETNDSGNPQTDSGIIIDLDGGVFVDAGNEDDAGFIAGDAGLVDSGPFDSGIFDGGLFDSGIFEFDAGFVDASVIIDAGTEIVDASIEIDAGEECEDTHGHHGYGSWNEPEPSWNEPESECPDESEHEWWEN